MSVINKYDYIKLDILEKYKIEKNSGMKKLPTVRELMQIYNVSYSTISRVLLDLENENKIVRKHGKGIFINEVKEKRIIVLALPLFQRIDYFIWGIIQGVMQKSGEMEFTTIILNSNVRLSRNLKKLISQDISGVIFFPSDNNDIAREYSDFFINNKINFVFLDRYIQDNIVRVVNNHYNVMVKLGKYIVKKNFKRVYFVYANRPQLKLTTVKDKINGIRDGIGEAVKFRAVTIYTFYNFAVKINPNNVFIAVNDDFLMFEIIDFFKRNSKDIINISGYGNLFPHNYITVDQNSRQLGIKSVEVLYNIMQKNKTNKLEYKIDCSLIRA